MEMLAAIEAANEIGIKFALIDRDIKITIKRAISKMSLLEKLRALKEMMGAFVLSGKEVQKEMEKAKTENGMARLLGAFEKASPSMYEVLVRERDAYMAKELLKLQEKFGNIVAVVGAGHKKGIEEYLSHPERISRFWTGK
jgi:pheromone shutdown protein TraB